MPKAGEERGFGVLGRRAAASLDLLAGSADELTDANSHPHAAGRLPRPPRFRFPPVGEGSTLDTDRRSLTADG